MHDKKTVVEVLDGAIRLIKRGWAKDTFVERDESGRLCYCTHGALRRAAGAPVLGGRVPHLGSVYEHRLSWMAGDFVRDELRSRGLRTSLVVFNDLAKDKQDVVDLLKAAKTRAEARA